jgi:D-psicose/D-tagatose/L-ribulose 3-epimerase
MHRHRAVSYDGHGNNMKYSITLASFRKIEPIEETLSKLTCQGFDAVEMFGEPAQADIAKLKDTFSAYRIPVCGITGMWGSISEDGWQRKLLSSDPSLIRASKKYVQDCVRMCNSLGGKELNVCLFADDLPRFDRTHGQLAQQDKDRLLSERAVPALAELCAFAADYGVQLVLEPLNRYSTPYCSAAKDAIFMAHKVNSDSLGVLLDTFHMNIEEDSFEGAIWATDKLLKHTHFADNNRKMPGSGHVDFKAIVKSLKEIGYSGYASFEPNVPNRNYESATKAGLEFVQGLARSSGL